MSIYDFKMNDASGNEIDFNIYKGKVLLIVNTATECGFTPQYEGLQNLYEKYKEQGFEVIDFPCNQFGNQAPGTNEEIVNFCQTKYKTTFKQFAKIDVNDVNEAPIYTYLKSKQGGLFGTQIKWNFTKFLVDKEGNVVKRFASTTKPEKIAKEIESLLNK